MTLSKITIFSSLKTFYEAGNDLFGVFGNLILQEISQDKTSLEDIKTGIENHYKFNIPLDVVCTILKRLKHNSLITFDDINIKSIYVLEKGEAEKIKIINSLKEADRENAALIKSIGLYVKEMGGSVQSDDEFIANELSIFIENNIQDAISLIENDGHKIESQSKIIQSYIIEFFQISEKSDQVNFKRLKAVLYGKIISSSLLKRNFEQKAKFDNFNVYIDTNIFFSLIGLHEDCYNIPAQELIENLKKLNIHLNIFSFTKDEIISKLRGYLKEFDYYTSTIKVNSIYDVLKRKKYSKTDVIQIIENIDDQIEKMGIAIDYSYDIESILKDYADEGKVKKYNPDKGVYSVKHDIAAIFTIRKLRSRYYSSLLEKSKFVFLTADYALAAYNFREFNHKENGTVPEIILRNELAAILWLKDSAGYSDNSYVHSFLANHIRQQTISGSLWDKFINEIKAQTKKGLITSDDIDLLINYSETEKILREQGEEGIKILVNEEKIKELRAVQAERDKKIKDGEINLAAAQEQILNSERELVAAQEQITNKEKELEEINNLAENQADLLQLISKTIESDCRKKWNLIINYTLWPIFGTLIGLILFIYSKISLHITINPSYFIILLLILILILLELRFKKQIIPEALNSLIPRFLNFIKIRDDFERNMVQKSILAKRKKLKLK